MTDGSTRSRHPAPTIDEIVVGDDPDTWVAGGFTVDDDATCRVGGVRIALVGRERGKRILSWSLREASDRVGSSGGARPLAETLASALVDGLVTTASDRPPPAPARHPNGARQIDHVVLATPDCERTVGALEAVGFDVRGRRDTDSYGAPMRQTFFKAGEVIVELIGPGEPSGDGPAAFFGLALTVDDLDATAGLLGDALGDSKDAVQPGRRIATLRHKQIGMSVAIAFMSPEPSASAAT